MTRSESAAAKRHAASGERGTWESRVPDEFNAMLARDYPGRENANLRLRMRQQWCREWSGGADGLMRLLHKEHGT